MTKLTCVRCKRRSSPLKQTPIGWVCSGCSKRATDEARKEES